MKAVTALDSLTIEGRLWEKTAGEGLRCLACAHHCVIPPGRRGACKVRFNENGVLRVPWGYVAALQVDPIEKKPFAHFLPGSQVLTFGMLGCNFRCDFCQNWLTSQTLRDPRAEAGISLARRISPEQMASAALRSGAQIIASSYNEPFITLEWAQDVFRAARRAGLKTAVVSNGYAGRQALEALAPDLDAIKVDLKCMTREGYRALGGRLEPVLETIQHAAALGLWVEVVTLVIPGFNDSNDELWQTARFLTSVTRDLPWHVTAYHPDYRRDAPATTAEGLQRAAEIGQEAGLNYVYAGNLPGRVGSLEDTHCPVCQRAVIRRRGYRILAYALTGEGTCAHCGAVVAGRWAENPGEVHTGAAGWL